MKKMDVVVVALLASLQFTNAQTTDKKFAIGLNYVKNEYNGDYGNGIFDFNQTAFSAGGLSLGYFLSPSFDLGLQGSFGNYGYTEDAINRFSGSKLDASIFSHYKLYNGYIFSEDSKLSPFLSFGLGFASYGTNNNATPYPTIIKEGVDFNVSFGLGFKFPINSLLSIQYQYYYNFTSSDNHDQNRGSNIFGTNLHPASKTGNDAYGQHIIGIVFNLGKIEDSDKDGIADKFDECMGTPLNVEVDEDGCPIDFDGDGVPDYLDKCSNTPSGVKVDINGCPITDTDGDGIADYLDKCPTVAGIAKFQGCPDTDGDGIQDSEDKCPEDAGLAKFQGCPDTDGDGFQDSEDKCPTVAGTLNGCPEIDKVKAIVKDKDVVIVKDKAIVKDGDVVKDRDKDGIADIDDKCPDVPGVAANNGCPEIKAKAKKVFEQALLGIQFESDKDVIKNTSVTSLNDVVSVMKENPTYKLEIDGHTDSQGDKAKNLALSQKRADAVKTYLINKGVKSKRLIAKGFGDKIPVADNDTSEGRAKNRRVELKVNF